MGFWRKFFDIFSESVQNINEDAKKAQSESDKLDVKSICRQLNNCSGVQNLSKMSVYSNALKNMCKTMSSTELKSLFSSEYSSGHLKSCQVIKSVMDEMGI